MTKEKLTTYYRGLLNDRGQEIWDRIYPHLEIKPQELESVYIYCKELAKYEECEAIIQEKGLTQVSQTGYEQQRPEVSMGQTALKIALGIAPKLGLVPEIEKKERRKPTGTKNENKLTAFRRKTS